MSFVVSPILGLASHQYYGLLRLLIQHPSGFHFFSLYLLFGRFCTIHWMRPLLFHHLLSQHPILPTPESSSRLFYRFFAASIAFAMRDRLGSLFFPLRGQHVGAASFTLCYGLLFRFPFSGSYNASTQSVTRLHRLPAIWRPDPYQSWTSTSKQTMIYQDTPRFVGLRSVVQASLVQEDSAILIISNY
ncbi:MAG: hypothetical protein MUO31_12775 [Thermodesulfovibrionales bacterium]|nr:hypothetical protein [Thermodesulfovibrionales bacterium]